MKRIILGILLFGIIHNAKTCAFHFVPFGADWDHSYLLNTYPFLQDGRNIGIINYQRIFQRSFTLDTPLPNLPSTITLRENILTKSMFSRIYSSHRMQCNLAFSATDIRFDAISETGINKLHSWSTNEITFFGKFLLFERFKNKNHSYFFFDYGLQTALISKHGIDNTIGWLKLEMDKITPRLLPCNYINNLSLGLSALIDFKRMQINSSGNFCKYSQAKDGFIYGNEMNLSSTICYKAFVNNSTKIQLHEGFYFEHGWQDEFYKYISGIKVISAPCGLAQGSDLFLSSGMNFQYNHISCFAKYYYPLWQKHFSEHQLFNQSIFLTGIAYTF
ncbi:MAG: hypothetical protein HY841_11825 [Bacteroidetes bacterium]|nr:hypothetical protein [Bacteroidota bacterium]